MKLCTYQSPTGPRIGVVSEDMVFDAGFDGNMIDLIRRWPADQEAVARARVSNPGKSLSETELLAPVPRPGKIFAIGLNYADHILESKVATPEHQVWFTKAVTAMNGPYAPVEIAKAGPFVDY